MFGLYFGALGFLIPALIVAIVDFNLEKKWMATRTEQVEEKPVEQPKVEERKQEVKPQPEPEPVKAVEEPLKEEPKVKEVKTETPKVEEKPKKSKKGLIIGLSVGGGVLLLAGVIVGSVFGIKAIANAINESTDGGSSSSKDVLPSDYVFTVSGSVDYETKDTMTGFVFLESGKKIKVYEYFHAPDHSGIKVYEIKFGTWAYTQSTQTIKVTIDQFEVYTTNYVTHNYDDPEVLTFKIKSTTKMVYSSSNISDTVVNKVSSLTNGTTKYYQ